MAYNELVEPDEERLPLASALITALHLVAVPTIVTLTAIFPSQLVAAFPWTVAIIISLLVLLGGLTCGYFQINPWLAYSGLPFHGHFWWVLSCTLRRKTWFARGYTGACGF